MRRILEALQPLGRALMLPIAVLPVAGLLLRLGQPDLLNIALLSAAGDALFSHLGLLFSIGVATGYARDGNGAACLAGIVCFLVGTEGAKVLMPVPLGVDLKLSGEALAAAVAAAKSQAIGRLDVPIGIVSGLVGGTFYNRFAAMKLPEYLAFFGGRRFVPIVSGVAGLAIALVVGMGFHPIVVGIDGVSHGITDLGGVGLFLFGLINRLLLVTGLHHVFNNLFWFVFGDYNGAHGDIRRFFAGDPTAGSFMTGFFPVMMFGLPAACLAMYRAALPERRKAVGGMLFSLALTSLLTGVTEPIEFSFMFLAPVLYAIHAVLTGLSMWLTDALGMHLGFGFSAGLFDYVLNFGKATRPLLLLPVGLLYFAVYYGVFSFAIRKLDLKTPGREDEDMSAATPAAADSPASEGRGAAFLAALGGSANIVEVSACTTRLRLIIVDHGAVAEVRLKALGARGLIRPSDKALQVILGPVADIVSVEIREAIAAGPAVERKVAVSAEASSSEGSVVTIPGVMQQGLGGAANVLGAQRYGNRLRVELQDPALLDAPALTAAGVRGVAAAAGRTVHLLFAPEDLDRFAA
ncbi:PTS system N-acetylglucosamine-specific IIB component (Glc family) /PTS system N-acetylglucosamine-specific IIC component (Glc family) [Novosphingobium sp. PhB165]|uniref:N-acetylglucosamine-specific PTS transporter subunit IIBC n=1 Tax=Novosphingobium sp. PhB165 TaxID=2485105 RepID=UPI00104D2C98|nr:N-acetylglucosamine-specific PTS transporter subunit IIBC [Novosphingobium sp. PhB165]TCM16038.1 PTS system N-acetylglucosamine-specific IIB component (Glc family) /PTS system N-acetylglucosamine-specific IIC component (Glc family) [Novosphingobium sp. PhB165]